MSVDATALSVRTDYSAAELSDLASAWSQAPAHQVLGFYADTTGFRLQVPTLDPGSCEDVFIGVQFVVMQRVIELASDMEGKRCLFDAALKHYKHHAEVKGQALAQVGRNLEPALSQMVVDYLSATDGNGSQTRESLDDNVREFISLRLREFQEALPARREAADSPAELQAMRQACSV